VNSAPHLREGVGDLINEARGRYEFLRRELDYAVNRDDVLTDLRAQYDGILGPGLGPGKTAEESPADDDDSINTDEDGGRPRVGRLPRISASGDLGKPWINLPSL